MRKRLPEITADWLLERVVERDGCLVWMHSCCNGGRDPQARINGRNVSVRRAVWSAMHDGRQPRSDRLFGVSCGTPRCVDPAHTLVRTRSQTLRGIPKTLAHKAAIAATKRKASKLPQHSVPEILRSELSGSQEAERHGICKDMVNQIRAGKARRDYSSPFVGLGA